MKNFSSIEQEAEIEQVRNQLVDAGEAPWPAMQKAAEIVRARRRKATDVSKLPEDVRRALAIA